MFEGNLNGKVTICDQGASNRSALTHLGVTKKNPQFRVHNKIIFALYDAPHPLKSIPNNILNGDFILDNKTISFLGIIRVYNIDKNNGKSRALPKLTNAHIFPNPFQKMSVKKPLRYLLSHSVAAALRTCAAAREIESNTVGT